MLVVVMYLLESSTSTSCYCHENTSFWFRQSCSPAQKKTFGEQMHFLLLRTGKTAYATVKVISSHMAGDNL